MLLHLIDPSLMKIFPNNNNSIIDMNNDDHLVENDNNYYNRNSIRSSLNGQQQHQVDMMKGQNDGLIKESKNADQFSSSNNSINNKVMSNNSVHDSLVSQGRLDEFLVLELLKYGYVSIYQKIKQISFAFLIYCVLCSFFVKLNGLIDSLF